MIHQQHQQIIDEQTLKYNAHCQSYDYKIDDEVLIKNPEPNKLDPRFFGSYCVHTVHCNSTLIIQQSTHIFQRINIQRVKLYCRGPP